VKISGSPPATSSSRCPRSTFRRSSVHRALIGRPAAAANTRARKTIVQKIRYSFYLAASRHRILAASICRSASTASFSPRTPARTPALLTPAHRPAAPRLRIHASTTRAARCGEGGRAAAARPTLRRSSGPCRSQDHGEPLRLPMPAWLCFHHKQRQATAPFTLVRIADTSSSYHTLSALVALALPGSAYAQAVQPRPEPPPSRGRRRSLLPPIPAAVSSVESPLMLSPFEVVTDRDNGYIGHEHARRHAHPLGSEGCRGILSVVTKDFMEDIAANDLENLLTYTLGTEIAGAAGQLLIAEAGGAGEGLNFKSALERVVPRHARARLASADTTRGFFASSIPVDGYNMERAESAAAQRHALRHRQPCGHLNNGSSARRCAMTRPGEAPDGSYGSARYELDHDETLIATAGIRSPACMTKPITASSRPTAAEGVYMTSTYYLTGNTSIRFSGELGSRIRTGRNTAHPMIRPACGGASPSELQPGHGNTERARLRRRGRSARLALGHSGLTPA